MSEVAPPPAVTRGTDAVLMLGLTGMVAAMCYRMYMVEMKLNDLDAMVRTQQQSTAFRPVPIRAKPPIDTPSTPPPVVRAPSPPDHTEADDEADDEEDVPPPREE